MSEVPTVQRGTVKINAGQALILICAINMVYFYTGFSYPSILIMLLFIIGLVLFFAVHSISIVHVGWRDAMVERLGTGVWRLFYSLVSLAGLLLLIWGYGIARSDPVILYTPPAWLLYVNFILMLFVFPLALSQFFPGRIKAAVKHPVFASVKIWAFAHLLTNGGVADILLFGCFLVWAVAGRVSMKYRRQRPVPGFPESPANDLIAVVLGLLLYLLFIMVLHNWLIGVALV